MSLSASEPVLERALLPPSPAQAPDAAPAHACERGIDSELLEAARVRLELLYGEVAADWPGFIERPGQYQMMQACLLTFLSARTPDDEDRTGSNLAQLEAGTGTGKTVAYCLAAIVASEVLKKTVIVSTATVALQEQLFHKDLPRLAKIIPELSYDILKGRARYVCEIRLEGASVPDPAACLRHYADQAKRACETLPCTLDVPYGAMNWVVDPGVGCFRSPYVTINATISKY